MEKEFIAIRVHDASAQLTLAHEQLLVALAAGAGGAPAGPLEEASKNVSAARSSIDEIKGQMVAEDGERPELRACSSCGKSIRAAATLCGFCWTKA